MRSHPLALIALVAVGWAGTAGAFADGRDAAAAALSGAHPPSAPHYDEALLSRPQYGVRFDSNVRVPMRDGITLATDIYRPDAPGRFPVILERTPYDRANMGEWEDGHWFASRGYVYIVQDVRGRYDSDGHFYAFRSEERDGYDTDDWIGHQPWFKTGICTIGGSYVGYTQWAQAVAASPYLKCVASGVTTGNVYDGWIYINGVFHYGFDLPWGGVDMQGHVDQFAWGAFDWPDIYPHLPVLSADEAAHHHNPFYRDWIAHPTRDQYWDGISLENQYGNITVPILSVDGWYDIFLHGALEDDAMVRKEAKTAVAREDKRIMIGPWAHSTGTRVALYDGRAGGAPPDPIDFGDNAEIDMNEVYLRWFDHWLKGIDNGVGSDAKYQIFVMGRNDWRNENEWPLARTRWTDYYISSGGRASSSIGDGVLSPERPRGAAADRFTYDPAHPVPSMGGNVCCSTVPSGPWNQAAVELRPDVLVYTTPKMTRPMEITGPLRVILYASTSAKDTDWTAKLVDVQPGGFVQNIQSGIVRARFRSSDGTRSVRALLTDTPIVPDRVYRYTIDLWATSYVILPGHALRLEIASSDFPRFDRNLNTLDDPETGTRMAVAHQTVYHSARYPSHIILPIIPQESPQ